MGVGEELMSGPASLSLSRVFCICGRNIQKTRDNKREAGTDMSSYPLPHPTPIVAQIFGFFVFFLFSRWFCYAFGKDPLVFLVFSGFPKGFAIFVCKAMDDIHHRRKWYDIHKLLFS